MLAFCSSSSSFGLIYTSSFYKQLHLCSLCASAMGLISEQAQASSSFLSISACMVQDTTGGLHVSRILCTAPTIPTFLHPPPFLCEGCPALMRQAPLCHPTLRAIAHIPTPTLDFFGSRSNLMLVASIMFVYWVYRGGKKYSGLGLESERLFRYICGTEESLRCLLNRNSRTHI